MSALDDVVAQISDLSAQIAELRDASPVTFATVTAVDPATNAVGVTFNGGAQLAALPALSNYLPEVGHVVMVALNGPDPVIVAPPGPMTSAAPAQVTGVVADAGISAVAVRWTANTEPDMVFGRGTYEVQVDTSNTFNGGVGGAAVNDTVTSGLSAQMGPLSPGVLVYCRVRAIDMSGVQGPWSVTVTATPFAIDPLPGGLPHVSVLPMLPNAAYPPGIDVVNDADSQIYHNLAGVWTELVLVANSIVANMLSAGSVTANAIAANAITAGKIAANAVTAGTVDAAAITARELAAITLTVGQYVRSGNYEGGTSGWTINADGYAEFNNVTVRGRVAATSITASQITTTEGRNLLPNPGFEVDVSGWLSNVTAVRDTAQHNSGVASLKLTTGTSAGTPRYLLESGSLLLEEGGTDHLLVEGVPGEEFVTTPLGMAGFACVPGATYEARCAWRYGGASTSFAAYCGIMFYDSTGAQIGTIARGPGVYLGINTWGEAASGGQVAPANARFMAVQPAIFGFGDAESVWLDDVVLYASSTFVGSLFTSSAPDLPRVQVVDSDATYGPSLSIYGARGGVAALGLMVPTTAPVTKLTGAAFDSNIPTVALTGGDNAGGASSAAVVADRLAFHGVTPVAQAANTKSARQALQDLGLVATGGADLFTSGAGTPVGSVTPTAGAAYFDTTNNLLYVANATPVWVCITPKSASVATSEDRAVASYGDLATAGPSVTTTTATSVIVTLSATFHNAAAPWTSYMSVVVSGASTIAASDTNSMSGTTTTNGSFLIPGARRFLLAGLTAGVNTFKAQYKPTSGTSSWFNRDITVEPQLV